MIHILYLKKYLFQGNLSILVFLSLIFFSAVFEIIGLTLLLTLVSSILFGSKTALYPYLEVFLSNFSTNIDTQLLLIILVFSFYLFKAFFNFYFILKQQSIIQNGHYKFSSQIFNNYINGIHNYTSKIQPQEVIRDIGYSAEKVFNEYFINIFNFVTETFILFFIFFFFFSNEPVLTFYLIFIFLIIIFFVYIFFIKESKKIGQKTIESYSIFSTITVLVVNLFKELRTLNILNSHLNEFNKNIKSFVNSKRIDSLYSRLPMVFIEITVVIIVIALILYIFRSPDKFSQHIQSSNLNLVAMFALGMIRMIPSINRISNTMHSIRYYLPVMIQMDCDFYFLKQIEKIKYDDGNFLNFNNTISFKNFSLLSDEVILLKNFSASFHNSEKTVIYGKSGSGKTSLFNFFSGLLNNFTGSVKVDGKANEGFFKLNQKISLVGQENQIIENESIFYNITMSRSKNDIDYKKYSRIVDICKLDEYIKNLPFNEDTKLNLNISGGERQRICIARAIFIDFDILLMDEPFSNLDNATSDSILNKLITEFKDKTVIIISHSILNENLFDQKIELK